MKTTKHTPGPWTCQRTGDHKRYIIGDGQTKWGTEVAEVYSDDTDHDEAAANAALIQHTPDMLQLLTTAYDILGNHETVTIANGLMECEDDNNEDVIALRRDIAALIAKATGVAP